MNNYERMPTKFDWVPIVILVFFVTLMGFAYNDQETDKEIENKVLTLEQ